MTAGLNLDLTVNTDFAQVEVDEQQVNLTRFGLFYPEKRDFFLENSNFFTMGTGSAFTTTQVQTDLFFSRRIGLSDAGQPIPIKGGGRLAGKSGKNNVGVLDIQTDNYLAKPGDNFFVGRYSRDVFKRSRIGALFVNKASVDGSDHFNRTFGVDANLAPSRNVQINSYLAKTQSPGKDGKDMAFFGRVAYRDPNWNLYLNYLDVQENFNAEAGFVQRTGVRTTKMHFEPNAAAQDRQHQADGAHVRPQLHHRPDQSAGRATESLDARHDASRRLVHQRRLPADAGCARPALPHPAHGGHSRGQLS